MFFQEKGCKIYTASNQKEAVGIVRKHKIDVAIVDLRLASNVSGIRGVSGVKVAKKLLEIDKNLRVIFMSAIIFRPDTIQGYPLVGKFPKQILEGLKEAEKNLTEQFKDNEGNGY